MNSKKDYCNMNIDEKIEFAKYCITLDIKNNDQ